MGVFVVAGLTDSCTKTQLHLVTMVKEDHRVFGKMIISGGYFIVFATAAVLSLMYCLDKTMPPGYAKTSGGAV